MDRGAWQAIVQGVARVGHDLATKPPPNHHQQPVWKNISWLFFFCISLIISDIRCLFMYLLFTYKLSLGKCLFKSWRALFITVRWRLSLDQVCTFRVQRQHSLWPTGIPGLGKQSSHITIDPRAKINEDSRCDAELNNSPVCWHSGSFLKLREMYSGLILQYVLYHLFFALSFFDIKCSLCCQLRELLFISEQWKWLPGGGELPLFLKAAHCTPRHVDLKARSAPVAWCYYMMFEKRQNCGGSK